MHFDLEKQVQNDIDRYKRMKEQYRSSQVESGEAGRDAFGRRQYTGDVERHFDNIIRELEAIA